MEPHNLLSFAPLYDTLVAIGFSRHGDASRRGQVRRRHPANCVYVIPPNALLALSGRVFQLSPRSKTPGHHLAVNFFMHSLAQERRGGAIAIVLSGTGSDGTAGKVTAIRRVMREESSIRLSRLVVFRFRLQINRDAGIGVLPLSQKILIGRPRLVVVLQGVCSGDAQRR
jgi:CheB methylesterase